MSSSSCAASASACCLTRRRNALGALLLRAQEHVVRRPLLDDDALIHEDHAVGDLAREAHLVGDHDHGGALLGEIAHHTEDLTHQLGVERRRGLIEEHQFRLHRQGTRDGDTLLLPAGELRRIIPGPIGEADHLQQFEGLLLDLRLGHPFHLHRRFHHVFQRRHMREEVEPLEDHPDPGALSCDVLVRPHVQFALALLDADELTPNPDPSSRQDLHLVDQA